MDHRNVVRHVHHERKNVRPEPVEERETVKLPNVDSIDRTPDEFLTSLGRIFAVFDERTQDSGNISYGVEIDGRRYFVKTAGLVDDPKPYDDHPTRVSVLRNAVRLAESCGHRALPTLHQVIESPVGPMLIYDWIDGELVTSSLDRIRTLTLEEVEGLLNDVYELHVELIDLGWITLDFYHGSMIYDFDRHQVHVVDLDLYRRGPFTNEMGRMFGSSRFLSPEELKLGATIDERTTVFTMGRTAAVLFSDESLDRDPFRGNDSQYAVMIKACQPDPNDRFHTMADFYSAWLDAAN